MYAPQPPQGRRGLDENDRTVAESGDFSGGGGCPARGPLLLDKIHDGRADITVEGRQTAEDVFGERLSDPEGVGWLAVLCLGVVMMVGRQVGTHWRSVAVPPAFSMPLFSASASWRICPYMEY